MMSQGPHLGTFRPAKSTFISPEQDGESEDGDGEWRPEIYTTPSTRARPRVSNFSKSPTGSLVDPRYVYTIVNNLAMSLTCI